MAGSDTSDKLVKPSRKGVGGRPTKLTPEVIKKLEEAFAIGASDQEACFYADISTVTLYAYQNKNPKFLNRKEALKERPVLLARQKVIKAIENNDMQTTRWFLERRKRKEFATQLNIADSEGKNMPAPILNIFANIGQETVDDTKRDVIEAEITEVEIDEQRNSMSEIRGKTLPATPSDDIKEHKLNGNIMDDING